LKGVRNTSGNNDETPQKTKFQFIDATLICTVTIVNNIQHMQHSKNPIQSSEAMYNILESTAHEQTNISVTSHLCSS
jgi:hypothetical protein